MPLTLPSFTPGSGAVQTLVTLTGTGFLNVGAVDFNGTFALFDVISDTSIRTYVPMGATTGKIGVDDGVTQVLSATNFTVSTSTQTPPPGSALDFTLAKNFVTSILNASTTYGTNDDIERHPAGEITDAIRLADNQIAGLILATPNHPQRAKYLSDTVPTAINVSGGLIPKHIGPVGSVWVGGKAATRLKRGEIQQLIDNPLGLKTISAYYDIVGERLYFVGGPSALIDICILPDNGATLNTPSEYFNGVVALALAYLFGKEGAEMDAAAHFKALADTCMELIKMNANQLPAVVAYEMQ